MTIILSCIIVLLVLTVLALVGMNGQNVNLSTQWYKLYQECDEDYKALEQGRDEESEAYEQQFLSFNETIEHQQTALAAYVEDFHFLIDFIDDLNTQINIWEILNPDGNEETLDKKKFEDIKNHTLL